MIRKLVSAMGVLSHREITSMLEVLGLPNSRPGDAKEARITAAIRELRERRSGTNEPLTELIDDFVATVESKPSVVEKLQTEHAELFDALAALGLPTLPTAGGTPRATAVGTAEAPLLDQRSDQLGTTAHRDSRRSADVSMARASPARSNKVFVVHGHNNEVKETVARYLERLGLEAVILHEQPSRSRTLIEKLEHHSDVSFAVVLMTDDDEGRAIGETTMRPRARQNVIFELGYFMACLGRDHVLVIRTRDVEVLSDFQGVIYVDWDGNWQSDLARELRDAGIPIDANRVF